MRNPCLCLHPRCDSRSGWSRVGGSSSLNASPWLQELINHSSSYLVSGRVHKGAIIEKDLDDCRVRREGEAEEDAEGAGFVCRRVAKGHYLSPFGVFNKLSCVVFVANLMTFGMVLWLNKYQWPDVRGRRWEDDVPTIWMPTQCQPFTQT